MEKRDPLVEASPFQEISIPVGSVQPSLIQTLQVQAYKDSSCQQSYTVHVYRFGE